MRSGTGLGVGTKEGGAERHDGINEQKGQPKSLNRRRTLVEWSSILHFHCFCQKKA